MDEYMAVQDIFQMMIWTMLVGAVLVVILFLLDWKAKRDRSSRLAEQNAQILDRLDKLISLLESRVPVLIATEELQEGVGEVAGMKSLREKETEFETPTDAPQPRP